MQARIVTREAEKQALIDRLSNDNCALMIFYEEAPDDDIADESVSEFITLIHPPYDYKKLKKWLYLGNWHAIFPANQSYQPFNTFKANGLDIEQTMKESKLKLIIDSFHDDIEWNVIEET
jgi:hypothetical protein